MTMWPASIGLRDIAVELAKIDSRQSEGVYETFRQDITRGNSVTLPFFGGLAFYFAHSANIFRSILSKYQTNFSYQEPTCCNHSSSNIEKSGDVDKRDRTCR